MLRGAGLLRVALFDSQMGLLQANKRLNGNGLRRAGPSAKLR
jgi:hypothetical protein